MLKGECSLMAKGGAHFCNHRNTIRKVCLEILIATGISNWSSSLRRAMSSYLFRHKNKPCCAVGKRKWASFEAIDQLSQAGSGVRSAIAHLKAGLYSYQEWIVDQAKIPQKRNVPGQLFHEPRNENIKLVLTENQFFQTISQKPTASCWGNSRCMNWILLSVCVSLKIPFHILRIS